MVKGGLLHLILLISLANGILGDGRARGARFGEKRDVEIPQAFRRVAEAAVVVERRIEEALRIERRVLRPEERSVPADITPAAELPACQATGGFDRRQANVQDQINSIQQSAQQAFESASQSFNQRLQSLSQSAQQATQQAQQSVQQAQQSAQQAQQSVQQAQQSASQAVSRAQSSASSAIASVTSSASSVLSASMSSMSASAASAISAANAAASASAKSVMNGALSSVQAAQADASGVSQSAGFQVQQAQGAVSVTQAALAIVGAIVGSSVISILIFYFIIRYRRRRLEEREAGFRREISYPKAETAMTAMSDTSSVYQTDGQADVRNPRASSAAAYATSALTPKAILTFEASPYVQNLTPREQQQQQPRQQPQQQLQQQLQQQPQQRQSSFSAFSRPREESGSGALDKMDEEEARKLSGELNGWLRSTRMISPFGNMADNPEGARGSNWPFDKRKSAKNADESKS